MEEIKNKLRLFIKRFYRKCELTDTDDFYEIGFANSLFIVQLTIFIEKNFGITLSAQDGILGELRTIEKTAEIIMRYLEEKSDKKEELSMYTLPNNMTIAHVNKSETDHFYSDIFEKKVYKKNGIEISDGDTVFDVGGNIGMFTLFALQQAKDVNVYSFEPVPELFNIICSNTRGYKENINLFNCGISNKETIMEMTYYPKSSGMSSFYADKDEEREALKSIILNELKEKNIENLDEIINHSLEERLEGYKIKCKLDTISNIIKKQDIDSIDLMKIDVQKSELDVLMGIEDNDWSKIKQIVIEVHDMEGRVNTISTLLESKGFSVKTEQDHVYKDTMMYNLYALRSN